ncbi:MAG: hypothetical protein K2X87_28895 [Gemmataceae bacterium]|nr:hypothetical protein [Gemmataceae bacterium]
MTPGLLFLAAAVEAARATGGGPALPASEGPYCGVYCVYAAARMLGTDADLSRLLSREYVGSYRGSSAEELCRAARACGLVATPMTGLTPQSLRDSRHPVVLHVRRPGLGMPYLHWVLYAGDEGGLARVVEPPAEPQLLPYAELAALWDGAGVVVSTAPPDPLALRAGSWGYGLACVAVVTAALGLLRAWGPARRAGPVVGACVVVGVGGAAGVALQALDPDGLLRDRSAVALVVGHHFPAGVPEIDAVEARALAGAPAVTFIDARLPADYALGHVPGAVNLPVSAGLAERRAVTAALPPGGPVVVYCQSRSCQWADTVAADLYHRGYRDVRVFRGGWVGWAGDDE